MKIILIILIICVIAAYFLYENKRKDELAEVARQTGFTLTKGHQKLPTALDTAGFYLFTQGPPNAMNVLRGNRDGYQITLLEYFYNAAFGDEGDRNLPNSDNDSHTDNRAQLVAWVVSDQLNLPEFDLSPRDSPIRSAAKNAGYTAVSFDNSSAFNSAFTLAGRDAQALRLLFDEQMRDWLLQHRNWVIESRGSQWLFYIPEQRTKGPLVVGWLDEIQQFLDLAITNAPH